MDKYISKRLARQALVSTHPSVESAIQSAALCLISVSKNIHLGALLTFMRQQTGLTRSEVRKAVDSLAKVGRIRIQAVLGCILICDAQNGGVR